MTFDESVDYLRSLEKRGWRLELDRMREFVRLLELHNQPQKFIHIAGTNGKGSVTAFTQSILHACGYRVGGYFSPFVYRINERIQMNCESISDTDFARLCTDLQPISDAMIATEYGGPTEFEFKTALGLKYWAEQGADFVALEVGLGGRLDATNIITPTLCVITSIGLDHTHILGTTHAEIAREKAGIIKRDVPVVIGKLPQEAKDVVIQIAQDQNATVYEFGRDFGSVEFQTGISGHHQDVNAAIALQACKLAVTDLDATASTKGIASAKLPGRFEHIQLDGVEIILDGAHNSEASENLNISLRDAGIKQVVLVTSMLEGHDPTEFYEPLANLVSEAFVCEINFHRARKPREIQEVLTQLKVTSKIQNHPTDAFKLALEKAKQQKLPVLVTGSFYLLGDLATALKK